MKTRYALPVIAIVMAGNAFAQKADTPFLRIGDNVTTYGEFNHMYEENREAALTPMSAAEYSRLFTNYKLKVAQAKEMGLDTLKTYRDECEHYLAELAKPYLEDTAALRLLTERENSRLSEEIKAEHILISVRPNALPADTLAAYEKAVKARNRVLAGEDFAKVADEVSEDPSARNNHGDLGYFTAMRMVMPFEDAAYSTPKGGLSEVFRTQFGFHFMHVSDRRESEGQVMVQHIMKFVPSSPMDRDAEARAKAQIDSLYKIAISGTVDFGELAKENSDDRQSANRGGMLMWFNHSQILPEFADASFALANKGDISAPVRTRAGWHIIRLVDRRKSMPWDEVKKSISRAASTSEPYKSVKERAKAYQLAKEYNFKWNNSELDTLVNQCLSAPSGDKRRQYFKDSEAIVATINGEAVRVRDLSKWADKWRSDVIPSENIEKIFIGFMKDYETKQLDKKYHEYAYTSHEYLEGLLVFEITQREIWSQSADSATMADMYAKNTARYSKDGTFEGDIYFCNSEKDAAKVKKLVAKGQKAKAAKIAEKTVNGPIKQGDIYDDFIWPSLPVSDFVVVDGKVTNGTPKPLDECRGMIISDYQQKKEAEFLTKLRDKFNPQQLIKLK